MWSWRSQHIFTYVTAVLYAAFWVNAIVALVRWRRLARAQWPAATSQ